MSDLRTSRVPFPALRQLARFDRPEAPKISPVRLGTADIELLKRLAERGKTILTRSRDATYVWARLDFGDTHLKHDKLLFRGYVQVDFSQIREALAVIVPLAEKRLAAGQATSFKFLISIFGDSEQPPAELTGYFARPDPAKPVIAFWSNRLEDIKSILEELGRCPAWNKIEQQRSSRHRREGSSSFTNAQGVEFRTLCYNQQPGRSEEVVRKARAEGGVDWRVKVDGSPTYKGEPTAAVARLTFLLQQREEIKEKIQRAVNSPPSPSLNQLKQDIDALEEKEGFTLRSAALRIILRREAADELGGRLKQIEHEIGYLKTLI